MNGSCVTGTALALALLTSCATPMVITAEGPNSKIKTGQFGRFQTAYTNAENGQNESQFLSGGLALIDNNCRDYFRVEGKFQQVLYFVRDTANVLSPVAAGALAIAKGSTNAIAVVTLSTAATAGIISTAASDFLFDADNIDDVQSLVMTDLATHEDAVNQAAAQSPSAVTFDWVTEQLTDHQNHCLPAHILAVTRAAIKAGKLMPYSEGSTKNQPSASEVQALKTSLGTILGLTITDDEAAALYWLTEKADASNYYKEIALELKPLGAASPFDSTGKLQASWTTAVAGKASRATQVKSVFDAVSDPLLKGSLESTVGNWVSAAQAPPHVPLAGAPALALPPAQLQRGIGRIRRVSAVPYRHPRGDSVTRSPDDMGRSTGMGEIVTALRSGR